MHTKKLSEIEITKGKVNYKTKNDEALYIHSENVVSFINYGGIKANIIAIITTIGV